MNSLIRRVASFQYQKRNSLYFQGSGTEGVHSVYIHTSTHSLWLLFWAAVGSLVRISCNIACLGTDKAGGGAPSLGGQIPPSHATPPSGLVKPLLVCAGVLGRVCHPLNVVTLLCFLQYQQGNSRSSEFPKLLEVTIIASGGIPKISFDLEILEPCSKKEDKPSSKPIKNILQKRTTSLQRTKCWVPSVSIIQRFTLYADTITIAILWCLDHIPWCLKWTALCRP